MKPISIFVVCLAVAFTCLSCSGPSPAEIRAGDTFAIDPNDTISDAEEDAQERIQLILERIKSKSSLASLHFDYPENRSIFPPDMVAPTFLFHDSSAEADLWLMAITAQGSDETHYVLTSGTRKPAVLDARCHTEANTFEEAEYEASALGWTPETERWDYLSNTKAKDIRITAYGISSGADPRIESRGAITIRFSTDPVGAPIFYRDVPLMPDLNTLGVIKPLADNALPLIVWRLRDLKLPESRVVMKSIPTCGNCHSFSSDGNMLGMDMDGPNGDKGAYALAPVKEKTLINSEHVFSWNKYNADKVTYGLFSRVSPDGRYVVSAVDEEVYVRNYLDYTFLQTFYPTRGILAVYSSSEKEIKPLPGADDPDFVHCNPVWSPDGKTIVFLRARAQVAFPPGAPLARKANDPNERQIQYNLYTIPFNGGAGGEAKPLSGASANGMSNSFPKFSPDGKWIVYVQAKTGLLMRPDSELYIIPSAGGKARRLDCNLPLMNSWHSWSPNSRWLVFSSKARSPYTKMFLSHIDERGKASPAILIPNSTADNRAVNIPEFVNIPSAGLKEIWASAVDYKRHLDSGLDLIEKDDIQAAEEEIQRSFKLKSDYPETLGIMGYIAAEKGDVDQATRLFEEALELDPSNENSRINLGVALLKQNQVTEARHHFDYVVKRNPMNLEGQLNLGNVQALLGDMESSIAHYETVLDIDPNHGKGHYNMAFALNKVDRPKEAIFHYEEALQILPEDIGSLNNLSWILATCPDGRLRDGDRAVKLAYYACQLTEFNNAAVIDTMAAAYAQAGKFELAVAAAKRSLSITKSSDRRFELRNRLLTLYTEGKAFPVKDE